VNWGDIPGPGGEMPTKQPIFFVLKETIFYGCEREMKDFYFLKKKKSCLSQKI